MENIERKESRSEIMRFGLVSSLEEFKEKYYAYYVNKTFLDLKWEEELKPCEYPCVILQGNHCFHFVYLSDFKSSNTKFPGTHKL